MILVETRTAYVDPPGLRIVEDAEIVACVLEGFCPDCHLPLLDGGNGWLLCSNPRTRFTAHPHYRIHAESAEFDALYCRCAYPSEPAGSEDWEECDLPLGHDPDRDHEALHMWWPTRPTDRDAR